ncbi:CvpA family protein [Panacibacter sp. DH6]|uniref:CvpA family protein n=1 Tax=Panacibacter microcysteis TaxID=2793269 RepID=A0A931GTX3_9BACT|nr:CvpA family protein [Panacibacter microcysteis]MBG9376046.1 CvpA family protein [Panacibacter microcysteis]
MIIDVITLIILAMAVFKGFSRGLIVSILSFLGILIGLAAAMKLSVAVAAWLDDHTGIGTQWLPFIAFLVVLIGVMLLVRWVANLAEAAIEIVLLGWLNKLGGIVFYILLYMMVYSILLFYATEMGLLKPETIEASHTYVLIEPWGPQVISALGYVIPFFKDMFEQLKQFFENMQPATAV